MKEVRWTKTSRITLKETSDFIIKKWNLDINERFLDQLEYRITQIQQNPELGPLFDNSKIRRLVIHKTVSLFYIDTPQYLKLLVIWDNRQDPKSLLAKLNNANKS